MLTYLLMNICFMLMVFYALLMLLTFATYLCISIYAYSLLCLLMHAYVGYLFAYGLYYQQRNFLLRLWAREEREVFRGGFMYIRGLILPLSIFLFFLPDATSCIISLIQLCFQSLSLLVSPPLPQV
jgi:hypothetical protein